MGSFPVTDLLEKLRYAGVSEWATSTEGCKKLRVHKLG